MPYFPRILVGGVEVDLSHLEPFTFHVDSELAKKKLRVRALFTTHCFSERYGSIPHGAGDPLIDDDTKQPRTFCPVRFQCSLDLPKMILKLPGSIVRQTSAQRNWVFSTVIDHPAGPYHIFFEIKRSSPEQRTWQDLNLVIESAYPEQNAPPSVRGQKPFELVCGEAYTGNRHPALRGKRRR